MDSRQERQRRRELEVLHERDQRRQYFTALANTETRRASRAVQAVSFAARLELDGLWREEVIPLHAADRELGRVRHEAMTIRCNCKAGKRLAIVGPREDLTASRFWFVGAEPGTRSIVE